VELERFSKNVFKTMRTNIQFDLDKIADKYGISLRLGNISYQNYSFTSKIEGKILKGSANIEKEEFAKLASEYGFKPEDYGATFRSGGKVHTIYAIKTRNRKYPILTKCSDGKGYKFEAMRVLKAIGRLKKMMDSMDASNITIEEVA